MSFEETLCINDLTITLPEGVAALYKVEVSANGETGWIQIAQERSGDVMGGSRSYHVEKAPLCRFVRITFDAAPAN
jgi:hypothetical protein